MKKIELVILLILILIFTPLHQMSLFAASILLNTDETIEGRIIKEGKKSITVKEFMTNRQFNLKRSDIKEIKYDEKELKLKKENEKLKSKVAEPDKITFTESFQPRIGILPGLIIPMGDVGSALGMGIGGRVFVDFIVPLFDTENSKFMTRSGISLGYGSFSSKDPDIDATVTILPILVYAEASYRSAFGLKPYASIGLGITAVSLQKKTEDESISESSNDGTVSIGIGCGYTFEKIPQIEFILDLNYLIVFEEISGNFASVSIGAVYNFHTTEKTKDEKDEKK